MAQLDIKIEEIDPLQYHSHDDNIYISPNDIEVPINQVDLKGEDHCPTCGLWPSYHSMETRKKTSQRMHGEKKESDQKTIKIP